MDLFSRLAALKAKALGAQAVVSNHEQFGALCAALVAEKMGWPGTSVEAVLACQHKLSNAICADPPARRQLPYCQGIALCWLARHRLRDHFI